MSDGRVTKVISEVICLSPLQIADSLPNDPFFFADIAMSSHLLASILLDQAYVGQIRVVN